MLSESLEEVMRRAKVTFRSVSASVDWAALVGEFNIHGSTGYPGYCCGRLCCRRQQDLAAWLAGAAAVLTAVHKTLRSDEYQAECLRLNQRYRSLATLAHSVLENEGKSDPDLPSPQKLIVKFGELEESAAALLPDRYIRAAKEYLRKEEERDRKGASGAEPPRLERKAGA